MLHVPDQATAARAGNRQSLDIARFDRYPRLLTGRKTEGLAQGGSDWQMSRFGLHLRPGVRRQLSLTTLPKKHGGANQFGQAQRTNHGWTVPTLRLFATLYSTASLLGSVPASTLERIGQPL